MRSYKRTTTGITADADGILDDASVVGAVADPDGIAEAQNVTDSVALTLEAAAADLDPPRTLVLDGGAEDFSGINFTIVGTDQFGQPQQEVIAGPGGSAVTTTLVWSSVDSITPDDSLAEDLEVGWDTVDGVELITGGPVELNPPRRVVFTPGADLTGVTFLVRGRDRNGHAVSEVVAGDVTAITTASIFRYIDSIQAAGSVEDTVDVGWGEESISSWMFLGHLHDEAAYIVEVEGTVNYDVERTFRNIMRERDVIVGEASPPDTSDLLTGQTAAQTGTIAAGIGAIRLVQNSGTGTCTLRVIPAGGK